MKIDKSLLWLEPYIDLARSVEPKVDQITRIKNCVPQKGKVAKCAAQITQHDDETYSISIYTKYRRIGAVIPLKLDIVSCSKLEILDCLAHEISHIKCWLHSPERRIQENLISNLFMEKIKEEGYLSEEHEIVSRQSEY